MKKSRPHEGRTTCGERPWLPFAIIIAACAFAHLWCLGSQFYLDDNGSIVGSDLVITGHFERISFISWTYFGYHIQYLLFGMSPVGFHSVNWLLHTANACLMFAFARDFVRDRYHPNVALFGALLFAVHPLASEIPNYARTQDLAWVTLFSTGAGWAMLRFQREGGWWKFALCLLGVALATLSKGPGIIHALLPVAALGVAFHNSSNNRATLRRQILLGTAIVAFAIAGLWLSNVGTYVLNLFHPWSDPRFAGHGFTLARVFWEFSWRSVIPVALSADHHIAETMIPAGTPIWAIPDHIAMFAAISMLALTGFSLWLTWRKSSRLIGICLFLFVATIFFRVFFPVPEFMPEYRIYPGLPWFCLGAAMLLASLWGWMFKTVSPRVPAVAILVLFALLSAKRSFLWHDLDLLTADTLRQYPAQARAIWELQGRDVAARKWQAVIDRQRQDFPRVKERFIDSLKHSLPARELPTGHFALGEVGSTGCYALALAHQVNPLAGLAEISRLEKLMIALHIERETNLTIWEVFDHYKGLVLEVAGNYEAAAAVLRGKDISNERQHDLERVERKIAESKH